MVLNGRDPSVRCREFDRPLVHEIIALVLFGLVAVVGLRPVERIRVHVEHRSFDALRAAQQLRILIAAPWLGTIVDERLLDPDRIAAAREDEALFNADAAVVSPGQRHHELICVAQNVLTAR